VGQPNVLAMLDDQRTMGIAHGEWIANVQSQLRDVEANITRRVDAVLEQIDSEGGVLTESTFRAGLEQEINRLDGYVIYQLSELGRAMEVRDRAPAGRAVPVGKGLDVLVSGDKFDFVVPGSELGLLSFLLRHGANSVEPGVREVLRRLVRPGDTVIDGGASIGLHAAPLAVAVGPAGRVLCFEPLPRTAAALRRTLRLNGLADRTEVLTVALADKTGVAQLFVSEHGPLSSLFALPDDAGADAVEVEQRSLDDVLPPGSRLDVVKLDVEGAEPLVWQGMSRVRDENPRLAIVIEWSASHYARTGLDPTAFVADVLEAGYRVEVVDEHRPGATVPLDARRASGLEGANLVLLSPAWER
jgi:FkbM family methyltransferase